MISQYRRAISAFLSGLVSLLVAFNLLPADLVTPEVLGSISVVVAAVVAKLVPKAPSDKGPTARSPALAVIAAAALSAMLMGCAGAVPWNKQQFAGLTWAALSNCTDASCEFLVVDGKESGAIDFKVKFASGTIMNFAADDVRAFDGQALRAEVEKIVAEQAGDAAPGIVDAILDAVTGGATSLAPDG